MESSDYSLNAVIDDPDHFRFGSAAAPIFIKAALCDPDFNDIAVNSASRTSLRDEQVQVKSLDRDKPESPGIAVKFSCIYLFFLFSTALLPKHYILLIFLKLKKQP